MQNREEVDQVELCAFIFFTIYDIIDIMYNCSFSPSYVPVSRLAINACT